MLLIDQVTTKICLTLLLQLAGLKFQTASTTGFDDGVTWKSQQKNYKENIFSEILIVRFATEIQIGHINVTGMY